MKDNHKECVRKLIDVGRRLDFDARDRVKGKMYELACPDCVWYYRGRGKEELRKIARGDGYRYIPLVAFEVANSEGEKALRGSMLSLQLTNASASVIVLLGTSLKLRPKLRKMFGRYSYIRYRIWTKKDVDTLYDNVLKKYPAVSD